MKKFVSIILMLVVLACTLPTITLAQTTIKIGDYLEMGTYYGAPILWRCVDIDENGPLMLADRIICIKAFDGKGKNTSGSHGRGYCYNSQQGYYRRQYGSNYWADSNIRCWLNSTATAGNVVWACGNAPTSSNMRSGYNAYDQEAGFLTNFTEDERNAIKSVTQKSLLDGYEHSGLSNTINSNYHQYSYNICSVVQNYDTAYSEQVTDKMFLLDVKQINTVYNNRETLGNDYYIGIPTEQAVANSAYKDSDLNATTKWWYWLRSPYANNSGNDVRHVYSVGFVYSYFAFNDFGGVRPAFYLNLTSLNLKGGEGSKSNPYIISVVKTGKVKDGIEYTYGDGILTVIGNGSLDDYTQGDTPWESDKTSIEKVIIEDGITNIGAYMFSGYSNLTDVIIPKSVASVGEGAFFQSGLKTISYMSTQEDFGKISIGDMNKEFTKATVIRYGSNVVSSTLTDCKLVDGVVKGKYSFGLITDQFNMFTALYDGEDRLVKLSKTKCDKLSNGGNINIEVPDKDYIGNYKLKLMYWDKNNNLMPVGACNVAEISAELQ